MRGPPERTLTLISSSSRPGAVSPIPATLLFCSKELSPWLQRDLYDEKRFATMGTSLEPRGSRLLPLQSAALGPSVEWW